MQSALVMTYLPLATLKRPWFARSRPMIERPARRRRSSFPLFRPKEFPFVTIVPDDGKDKDKAGGWQGAKVNLEFIRIIVPTNVIVWHCEFKIEMPLRTEKMGKVSPGSAAKMSAEVWYP